MYTMSSVFSNLLTVCCAEDDWEACSKHKGRGGPGEPHPWWFNTQQLYNWPASVVHKRLQTLTDRVGTCGPGQQVALWSSPARLNCGLVTWKRSAFLFCLVRSGTLRWSLMSWHWSSEWKMLMVPCYTKFTSQEFSNHNGRSSVSSPKLKFRSLLLFTYSTAQDVCAKTYFNIEYGNAKSLLVGRL